MKQQQSKWSEVSKATVKHVRVSPRKARLVVDMIKGKQVDTALQILRFNPKKGAEFAEKLLRSALANAREKSGVDIDSLWVASAYVDMGRTIRRFMPAAQGRATPIQKRSSHITIVLGERVRGVQR
jgi:large subunit ribosomal protein L22